MRPELLPPLNAVLNSISALLLVGGYIAIRRRAYRVHGWMMSSAFAVSTLFLVGYVTHKILIKGEIKTREAFPSLPDWLRTVYLAILAPHVILAFVMVPMIFTLFIWALRRNWEKHRRLARWTFPIWLYVSVTGVIIYWMLYHLFPMWGTRV